MHIRIGHIGMGKTGKIVAESIFKDKRFDLVFAVKRTAPRPTDYEYSVETREMLPQLIKKFKPNIIVDFTKPEATLANMKSMNKGMGIVIGTTGFNKEQFAQLKQYGKYLKVLYAPNISDGINIAMEACKLIHSRWPEADIEIIEEHFKEKKSVSGTAKKIAQLFKKDRTPIHSIRSGGIIGVHSIHFTTKTQELILTHRSFSRQVFADGTKKVAIWLNQRKRNKFYTMEDIYA